MALPDAWNPLWAPHLPPVTPAREARLLDDIRDAVAALQRTAAAGAAPRRGAHAKGLWATTQAALEVVDDVPDALAHGFLGAGARWRAVVRFSNASPAVQPDAVPAQRGLAVRVVGDGRHHDLLLVDGSEAYHARDAEGHIALVRATAAALAHGGPAALAAMVRHAGPVEAVRTLRVTQRLARSGVSLAATDFFSRALFRLGEHLVKYRLRAEHAGDPSATGELGDDLAARRADADLTWSLDVHAFVSPARTPLDDARAVWDSPWVTLARLRLPRARPDDAARDAAMAAAEAMAFSPDARWRDDPRCLEPVGDINLLRRVYAHSVAGSGREGPATRACPEVPGS